MAKIQIKNSFITSSAQITISSSLVRFSDNIRAKGITGSFSGSFAGSNLFVQGGNSFGTTALLGTNDNQPLVLETNASEKMRVTAAGLVGIGTSSPIAKLHILGSGGGTDYVYQQWSYTSNVGVYDLILKQTVTSGVVRYNFSMNNASTAYNDVLVLDRGCVGIGTSFPLSKLDVRGTMYVNYGSNGTGYIQTNGTDSDLQITTATNLTTLLNTGTSGAMAFGAGNSERMRILSGGNVGIGTSSPTQKLEVIGAGLFGSHGAGTYSLAISNNDQTNARIRITNSGTGGRSFSIVSGNPGLSNAGFAIYDETSAATRMYISGSGNIGIGTTIPTGLLEVYASNNGGLGGFLVLNNNGNAIANETAIIFGDGVSTARRAAISSTTEDSPYYGDLKFKTGLSAYSSLTTRMIIKGAGNVGIGTSSPGNNLVVYNGSGWAGTDLNGTSGGELRFLQSGTLKANIYASTSTALVINSGDATIFQIGASEKMRLTGGNVGIGTTSPTAKLQVGTQMYGSAPDANYFVVGNENFSGPGPVGGITGYPATANRNQVTASLFDVAGGWESVNGYHALLRVSSYDKINSTPALTILNNGNLGLGTNSPSHQLTISRPTQASAYQVNFNTDGGISDGNYTGIRFSQGATGGTELGNIRLWYFTTGATALSLGVRNATQALYVATDGNIGIGTTNPVAKLHITGSSTAAVFQGNVGIGTTSFTYSTSNRGLLELYGATDSLIALRNSNNPFYIQKFSTNAYLNNTDNGAFILYTNNTERMRIAADGNVGIGTSSPAQKLHVVGAVYGTTYGQFGTSVASGTNSSYAVFGSNSAVVGVKINIDSNVNRNDLVVSGSTGNVGIGTSQVLSKLNAYASGSNLSVFRVDGGNGTLFEVTDQLSGSLFSVNDVSGLPLLEVFSNNRVVAGKYGSNALVVSGSSVGIGTSRPAYRLQVSGSFAATTKSFVIKHPDPAKSDKQLVHGVTEGPEHTVFVRGKLLNDNIIQLPDYWQHLVHEESITVTLTPNKYYQQLYVKNVTDTTIEVGSETDKPINCYYYIVGERKDIPKLITEI